MLELAENGTGLELAESGMGCVTLADRGWLVPWVGAGFWAGEGYWTMDETRRETAAGDRTHKHMHPPANNDLRPPALTRGLVMRPQGAPEKFRQAEHLRRAMTPAEAILWQHLRTRRLQGYHFRRQHVIAGFIVDFYCHTAGLVVEVDGAVHTTQVAYDAERDTVLAAHGLHLMRVTNSEIEQNLPTVLTRIAAACAR